MSVFVESVIVRKLLRGSSHVTGSSAITSSILIAAGYNPIG